MTGSNGANFELTVVLPLGVLANQMMKLEMDLRFLSARSPLFGEAREDARLNAQFNARLEQIHQAMDGIYSLLAELESVARKPPVQRDD
jgi:hypothetical protein